MNTKKMATSIIPVMMVIAIFAVMIGPASAYDYNIGKETVVDGTIDPLATYRIGDTVHYTMWFKASEGMGCTLSAAKDIFPDLTEETLLTTSIHLGAGEKISWETTYVVNEAGLTEGWMINTLRVEGVSDGHEPFIATCAKASRVLTEVEFDFNYVGTGCMEVKFTGSSTGPVKWHRWDFGDGHESAEINGAPNAGNAVTHEYTSCGDKTVKLYGCSILDEYAEKVKTVHVKCGPTAVATVSPECVEKPGDEATFSSASIAGDSPIVSYRWTFSDGLTGSSDNSDTTTRTIPDYCVVATLTVVDEMDCEDTDIVEICPCVGYVGCAIRLYGTYGEGAGNQSAIDPETGLPPENKPYSDPEGPFYPQHNESPKKDFMTFDPAIMDHNQGYPELNFDLCEGTNVQTPKEKVFKRMWYEKEWYKDHDKDGHWDVVIEKQNGQYVKTLPLDDWKAIHKELKRGYRIRHWNNDPTLSDSNVDIYAPSIIQEFTYMFVDDETMPIMIENGSEVLIPMAHDPDSLYRGLNSFDADLDGTRDALRVESEATLGMDIDHDTVIEPMDGDGKELSGDETVVLVLGDKYMTEGEEIQFFDHRVKLIDVFAAPGDAARFDICDNEGGGSQRCSLNQMLTPGEVRYFYRAKPETQGQTFYLKLISADANNNVAVVEVGRMFGQTYANIGANIYWNQKAFMVDEVFYNVVAIKAQDDCIKYITIRQKLPKFPIKLYGKHLEVWDIDELLPEMPPFNMHHEVLVDVLDYQFTPHSQQDKIGKKEPRPPLKITYVEEDIEERYFGSLLEIYNETRGTTTGPVDILFEIDLTSSMSEEIDEVKTSSTAIMNAIRAKAPDSRFGLVSFMDYNGDYECCGYSALYGSGGDHPYQLDQALTANVGTVATAISGLTLGNGEDVPECYTRVLYEAGNDPAIGWRSGALKVVIIFGDAPTHDCDFYGAGASTGCDPGRNGVVGGGDDLDFETVVAGIASQDIIVLAVDSSSSLSSNDVSGESVAIASDSPDAAEMSFRYMADKTGGAYSKLGDAGDLPDVVVDLVTEILPEEEKWSLEWFHTYPDQYTAFRLPPAERVLVTLSWIANESCIHLWNGDDSGPFLTKTGERVKFWYKDCTGPLYIDNSTDSIRLYGAYGEGAGNHTVTDPETGLVPENKPYTDPEGPFYPQHNQTPRKDFITFNPAIMDHNQGYPELDFDLCKGTNVQTPKEKVFKRMWYEKEWYKDHDKDGHWDVVIEKQNGQYVKTLHLDDWKAIHKELKRGYRIRHNNNDPTLNDSNVDIYAPSIIQEFTYMFVDDETMPIMIENGSEVLIPMAHDDSLPHRGLNSFDADGDGKRDAVRVESEATLGMDIDHDGQIEPMDGDRIELSGNETVVLVLGNKYMNEGDVLQFFDHTVKLKEVFGAPGLAAVFTVCDNEGGGSQRCTEDLTMSVGEVRYFYRAKPETQGQTFYLKLISGDASEDKAIVEVGRMFGQTYANIGANIYWSQKAFMVDGVFYNVVAIKARDDCIKYITFRQKLPKTPVKLYGKHLEVWGVDELLPEMSPFNMDHEILVDVLPRQFIPHSQQDKIGKKVPRPPLNITYVEEGIEKRFTGSLLEIYNETRVCEDDPVEDEKWILEWFHTQPDQYTAFTLPEGELYLMTLGWFAPESCIHVWDGDDSQPFLTKTGERVKFWYDPADQTDIYVNRISVVHEPKPDLTITAVTCGDDTIGYTVKNTGGADAGAQTVGLFVGGDLKGTDSVGALAPDESYTGSIGYTYAGVVTAKVCADINDDVDESNEGNNCMQKECGDDPIAKYDANGNGYIDRDELKTAIYDYLTPPIGTVIIRDDLKTLIYDYLAHL